MHKPTTEELQTELQEVVKKHNDALEIQNQCKTRFTEIQAILKDRASCEEVTEEG
jgi:hypothetical protein